MTRSVLDNVTDAEAKAVVDLAMKTIIIGIKTAPPHLHELMIVQIATNAISMIHGTFGPQFLRDYLRAATEEIDKPDALKIKVDVIVRPSSLQ